MFDPSELRRAVVFASIKGGEITCYNNEGVVLWVRGLAAAHLKVADLLPFTKPGDQIAFSGGLDVWRPEGNRAKGFDGGDMGRELGANPDFRPTNYTDAELRMRKLLKQVQEKSTGLEKRLQSLAKAAEAQPPRKVPAKSEPVIEPVETPETAADEEAAE